MRLAPEYTPAPKINKTTPKKRHAIATRNGVKAAARVSTMVLRGRMMKERAKRKRMKRRRRFMFTVWFGIVFVPERGFV